MSNSDRTVVSAKVDAELNQAIEQQADDGSKIEAIRSLLRAGIDVTTTDDDVEDTEDDAGSKYNLTAHWGLRVGPCSRSCGGVGRPGSAVSSVVGPAAAGCAFFAAEFYTYRNCS